MAAEFWLVSDGEDFVFCGAHGAFIFYDGQRIILTIFIVVTRALLYGVLQRRYGVRLMYPLGAEMR